MYTRSINVHFCIDKWVPYSLLANLEISCPVMFLKTQVLVFVDATNRNLYVEFMRDFRRSYRFEGIGVSRLFEVFTRALHQTSWRMFSLEGNRPQTNWPSVGKVEIHGLQVNYLYWFNVKIKEGYYAEILMLRYRPDAPLVLRGISCTFEGGHKIGIVGKTGNGKTTLISALFRLVELARGKI